MREVRRRDWTYLDVINLPIRALGTLGVWVEKRAMQHDETRPILAMQHQSVWCRSRLVRRGDVELWWKTTFPSVELQTINQSWIRKTRQK